VLEHLPTGFGHLLQNFRTELNHILFNDPRASAPVLLTVTSEAFDEGGAIPARYTEDGARLSPPLAWTGVPVGASAVLIIVEDADSPAPKPLVHAVVLDRAGGDGHLEAGQISEGASPTAALDLGRNSLSKRGYLPPNPPPGRGPHRYVFQVFALGDMPTESIAGRGAALEAMTGSVIAKGALIGTYERV
jgi:Raf kinase inhibitor-like YbhB/YbcL family protein